MDVVKIISDIIWSPVLVVFLVAAGIYFTVGTRFVQIRKIRTMLRILSPENRRKKGDKISSFDALCLSVSGRVGTGNIVGVATAIAIGGPGAIFWMWMVALLGASSAFVESTLAQLYKFKYNNMWLGGPFCYISNGLKCRWLAVLFAIVTVIGNGLFATTVQSNSLAGAVFNSFHLGHVWSGIILAFLIACVIVGGRKRIFNMASVVAPVMALGYLAATVIVLAFNWRGIPSAFGSIITNAFGINPLCGGILGSTIMMGVKRGLFSNEAGQGTGAIPSASADVEYPAEQGIAQSFSVYIDTLFVCTCTALMILTTGCFNVIDPDTGEMLVANVPELGDNYVSYTQSAVDKAFPGIGGGFVSIALFFFVFTSLMAYYFYSETSVICMCRNRSPKTVKLLINLLKALFITAIIYGAVKESNLVWTLTDIGVGAMVWINIIAILLLSKQAFKALKDYENNHS